MRIQQTEFYEEEREPSALAIMPEVHGSLRL
jgi:hypothetical protein